MPIGKKQLDELEKEEKEISMPVVKDLGIDKHIDYQEIKPEDATRHKLEDMISRMTPAEKKHLTDIRRGYNTGK